MPASTVDDLRAFTVAEVAERLGLSKRSVQRLIAEGQLATLYPRRPGVPVRIPAPSLRALLESGHTDGPGGAK